MNTTLNNKKTHRTNFAGFTGAHLKWIALITMLIDHISAVLLETGLLPQIASAVLAGNSFDYLPKDYEFWYNVNFFLRLIGRLAFPLYCFLLVEGFLHTKSRRNYALRLGIFALISEIPFDLAVHGKWFDLQMQNVFFTLFLGVIVLYGIRYLEVKYPKRTLLPYVIVFVGMFVAYFLQTDYDAFGILLIVMLYLLREDKVRQCVFGAVCTVWEYSAPLAFIPVWFYNGKRGNQLPKYFFYTFYPVHLLLLAGLRMLLFT